MHSVNSAVFDSLLDHFWCAVDKNFPCEFDQAPKGYLISYGDLIALSGVPLDPKSAGGPLFSIAKYCQEHLLPPLHSLAVNAERGYPGEGFFRAPGTDYSKLSFEKAFSAWQKDVMRCMNEGASKFPRKAPTID